jgi:ClpP class serine protease
VDIKVLLAALNHAWFIEPKSAEHYALMLHKLFTSEKASLFDDDDEQVEEYAWTVNASGKRIGGIQDAVANGVGVINMRGALMKYDYCGAPGTQSLMKALQQANDNPSLSAIVLQIDSPGGSVDGTEQFANAIKQSKKPVVAYVDGMMCSAAMWIGSSASERIASSSTDVIGSIGTMARWMDLKGYREQLGIKVHEVYATNSTHKNLEYREAEGNNVDGKINYEPLIKTWLDPLNNEFTGTIEKNLPDVDKSVLNGSHFLAKEAKKKGLIDKLGNFESAVTSALQLAKQKQNSTLNNMSFPKTLSAAKATAFSVVAAGDKSKDGGFLLSEEQMNSIESSLAQNETAAATSASEIQRLTAELGTANEAKKKAEDQVTAQSTQITAITQERDSFKQQAEEFGAATGEPKSTARDKDAFEGKNPKAKDSFDAYAEDMGVPRASGKK